MACVCTNQTLAGLCKDCEGSVGGIVEVYAAIYDSVESLATSGNMITGITLASGASFYKYQFRKNTGSMTSTLNVTDDGLHLDAPLEVGLVVLGHRGVDERQGVEC